MAKTYEELAHAMQSGVKFETDVSLEDGAASPKHLRVGINVAMVDIAALVRLLDAKGIVTIAEFEETRTIIMAEEVERYKKRLSALFGAIVDLA